MQHFKKLLNVGFIASIFLQLIGCSSLPVGWGGTHKVDYYSNDELAISYDSLLENENNVRNTANEICSRQNNKANLIKVLTDKTTYGLIKTNIYKCEKTSSEKNVVHKEIVHSANFLVHKSNINVSLYSEPQGASIYHINGKDRIFLCKTPCQQTIFENAFQGKYEVDLPMLAVWKSGITKGEILTFTKGENQFYLFKRPNIQNNDMLNIDLHEASMVDKSIEINRNKQISNIAAMTFLASAFVQGYTSNYGSYSTGTTNSILNNASKVCTSDYSCGLNEKCFKQAYKTEGLCLSLVDQYGFKILTPDKEFNLGIHTDTKGSCSFDIDCPIGFWCDQKLKVCIKK